jgi:DNA-directed RNA polymerase I, II, and III subunit RPABC1
METAYKTCLDILGQRDYDIVDEEDSQITAIKPDGTEICVFLINAKKLDVSLVKEYVTLLNSLNINHGIFVYGETITPYAKKVVDSSKDMKIELFCEKELQYNVTKHRLVPKHDRLPEDEAIKFKKEFGCKFGGILKTDPVARFYGYSRGDVIRITRDTGTNGEYITYRIVKG